MVKGVIQTLEAAIAAVVILSAIFYLYTPMQSSPERGLYTLGYSCLAKLDQSGRLAFYAQSNAVNGLKADLAGCIPQTVNFDAKICNTDSCTTSLPSNQTVVSVAYFSSGYSAPSASLVNLWMWSK